MRINGLNVKKDFDSEPSVETWLKAFLDNWPRNLTAQDFETANDMAQSIIDAYKQAEEYKGPISKLKKMLMGILYCQKAHFCTLLHLFLMKEKLLIMTN